MKILVMGVSGCGKSTVASRLAERFGLPFIEADDHHPAGNLNKMKNGIALNDKDRLPWLDALYVKVKESKSCVLACSALKEDYRKILMRADGINVIIYLQGSFDLIKSRMEQRQHFMPSSLLRSQFEVLEVPSDAIHFNVSKALDDLIVDVINKVENIEYNNMNKCDIGLLGLGVMGKSLARNLASKGLKVAVYNLPFPGEETAVADFCLTYKNANFYGAHSLSDFVNSLKKPRVIFLMIKAGEAIDEMVLKLKPFLSADDMIIDGGNSFFKDTRRRAIDLGKEDLHFVGVGVSGGEEGALKGPAIMPAGSELAKERILPMLEKIAAVADGQPCVKWISTDGAGHFVKMIHNGIEYADMQLLSEVYDIARSLLGMDNEAIAQMLSTWKNSDHDSYLLDISIDIIRHKEDEQYLLEQILDVAGHKGTGLWTSREALELGVAVPTITAAMNQRIISSYKSIRTQIDAKPEPKNLEEIENALKEGFLAARYIALTEGFHMMKVASDHYNWSLKFEEIAQLWRGGCIIRSEMLIPIKKTFVSSKFDHLFASDFFVQILADKLLVLNELVGYVASTGIPVPCLSASANYVNSMSSAELPINLIQGQRDYFGAHTYRRKDSPKVARHTIWNPDKS